MNLEDFIKETLVGIKNGIISANLESKKIGNEEFKHHKGDFSLSPNDSGNKGLNTIKFDIAVTVQKEKEGEKEGGIKIKVVNFGGSSSSKTSDQTISKIQFEVRVENYIIN